MMDQTELARFWQMAARRTARKVNFGWWFERFAPLLVAAAAIGFVVIFWLRSRHATITLGIAWPWLVGSLALLGIVAFFLAQRRFITSQEGLVRLEARLHMNNGLTAATHGLSPWPQAPAEVADGFKWRWPWIFTPVVAAVACLLAAFLLPIRAEADGTTQVTQPLSWPQIENWLKQLEAERVLEPNQLDELKERLDELKSQPEKDWFSHNTLEATDNLRDGLQKSISEVGTHLENAARALNALQNYSEELSAQTKEKLLANFEAAIEGLKANDLKIDPALLAKLESIDPSKLKALSKAELDQLREALKKKSGA
ncbi:MAG: hypothetical protein ACR2OZ_10800 [Verrucomicrobiales bacterium]